ncbi:thermonuclease family protein [Mycobacteroides abscessus]|uniref:thermonuclease family protein n=1 Tax=Mycobacteroides abscessus TaxID=36809 RepID=UPI00092A5087|nr:thermonuclease family protein [Mycobacteroides abscessus]SHQ46007.1 micrococcal nuclease-like nuclease [Mycobacteroides abscessus subsp. abscessus]SKQ87224.1 micrococcal nuclease-like nuclease [Mycobacteroides abscessus subsp. massiliense]SLC52138.1 micrococcal nuclease-like nuclease [Mycobacteroides abscessus subsp. massiliense]
MRRAANTFGNKALAGLAVFLLAAIGVWTQTRTTPAANSGSARSEGFVATVVKVVDGDTADIQSQARGRLRIRIVGINTPEVKKPGYSVGCGGPEASNFAKELLAGQQVTVVLDPSQDAHDRWGRTVAALFLADGRNFSVESAAAGHAHSYVYNRRPSRWAEEIRAAEQRAREASKGFWGPPCLGRTESQQLHSSPLSSR